MEELNKKTITTLEVAEMMETEHWKILRKLEGQNKNGKHIRGFIDVLNDNEIVVADYFIKSTYPDAKGEVRPCYEVTKLGCDFLANKATGEKGILFTARYVKRFYEMDNFLARQQVPLNPVIAGNVADLGRVTERIMKNQGSAPYKIAETFKIQCEQFSIMLPDDFVKYPEHSQMNLLDFAVQK